MKKELKEISGLFAFWRYDLFPYMLGGTVTHMGPNGGVYTKEYGYGHGFGPVKLLPVEEGKGLLKKLETLRAEYKTACDKLHTEFMKRAVELMPEIKG